MAVRPYVADLHIHSVLSPCGDYEMAPGPILAAAQSKRLDVIAITDHNSGGNVAAFMEASRQTDIAVLGGMEVTTAEEAHILTLFDQLDALLTWQEIVYDALPPIKNDEEAFGVQIEVTARDDVVKTHDRFYAGATSLSIDAIVSCVHALGGLCIPAHVDKPVFSVISQLGMIPPDLDIIAVEVYRKRRIAEACQQFPELRRYSIVRGSDAHYVNDVGAAATTYYIAAPTIQELRKALQHQDGRYFTIMPE